MLHLGEGASSCSVGYNENTDRQMVMWLVNGVSGKSWCIAGPMVAFDGSSEENHQKPVRKHTLVSAPG